MQSLRSLTDIVWNPSLPELLAKYQLFLEQHRGHAEYEIDGLRLVCPPNIYHPSEYGSTRFTLRGLYSDLQRWGQNVLEIGTGSGAIGLSLAKTGRTVTLLDIDPVAVDCTRRNAERNRLNVRVLQSDLFSAVASERFDTIIFNIPMLDRAVQEPLDIIACDEGGVLLSRYLREAKEHLLPGGYICVSLSNISNRRAILRSLDGYTESILYAEYYGSTGEWRWLVVAQPGAPPAV